MRVAVTIGAVEDLAAGVGSGEVAEAEGSFQGAGKLLVSCLIWLFLGTVLFFFLFWALPKGDSPLGSFNAAFLAGGIGLVVSSVSLRRVQGYRLFLVLLLAAYLLRVLVGVYFYQKVVDPDYFEGNGKFRATSENWEYQWTYLHAADVAKIIASNGLNLSGLLDPDGADSGNEALRHSDTFNAKLDKNAYIHTWMGSFLAAGGSRNALDLAPFNAFHHCFAAILVVACALACRFTVTAAVRGGTLVAWVPWGFAASIMWRDSVGFAWVTLAVTILCLGRRGGIAGTLLAFIPAAFLAWADRLPYLTAIAVIAALSVIYDQQEGDGSRSGKLVKAVVAVAVVALIAYRFGTHIQESSLGGYEKQTSGLGHRILFFPLLVLRGVVGPFPWFVGARFNLYVLCDYLFHVLQLAVIFKLVRNLREITGRLNMMSYATVVFWASGCLALGVHTAYLAVAFPFLAPNAFEGKGKLRYYLPLSLVLFAIVNLTYVTLGLSGSGLVTGTTGY